MQALTITAPISRPQTTRAEKSLRRLLTPRPVFSVCEPFSTGRTEAESFIASEFKRAYGARVTLFMPRLLAMRCGGRIRGVAGMRAAPGSALLTEQYLDCPAEEALYRLTGRSVPRGDIVEIGNLAATRNGASQLIFVIMASAASQAGFRYALFTATDRVARMVTKMKLDVLPLGSATPDRLGADAAAWGNYYATSPTVIAVDVQRAAERLGSSLVPGAVMQVFAATSAELARTLRARQ